MELSEFTELIMTLFPNCDIACALLFGRFEVLHYFPKLPREKSERLPTFYTNNRKLCVEAETYLDRLMYQGKQTVIGN